MRIEVQLDAEGCERTLRITVPADEVSAQWDKTLTSAASEAELPGFRKGKAPAKLVQRHLGEAIKEETLRALVNAAYDQALSEGDLSPITLPDLDVDAESFDPKADFSFTATLEVRPQVKLGEYKGLCLSRERIEVTDEHVSQFLDQKREEHAQFKDVEARPLRRGDWAMVDVKVSSGEELIQEKEGFLVPIGEGGLPDELDEKMINASPGETVQADVKQQPEGEAEPPGVLTYSMTPREVKERVLLDIDDEFAKMLGDFESLDDLRKHVREQMEQAAEERMAGGARDAALEILLERSEMDVPRSMVAAELEYMVYMTQAMYGRVDDVGKLAEDLRPMAERQVRTTLILDAIADAEGIDPEPAVVQQTVMRETAQMSDEEKDRWFGDGGPARVHRELRRRSALDLIIESATIEDKEESRIITPGGASDTGGPGGGLIIEP